MIRESELKKSEQTRVLYIVNVGWFFLSHRIPIATAALKRGAQVHVACSLDPILDTETAQTLRDSGFQFHEMRFSRRGSSIFELARDALDIFRLYSRVKPDIVHLVTLKPNLLGGIVARFFGIKCKVMAVPGRGSVFSSKGIAAGIRRYIALTLYKWAYSHKNTTVIVQNIEDLDYFVSRNVFRKRDIRLIRGSGVDVSLFAPKPEPAGSIRVVFAGRMLREKGVLEFVEAARALRAQDISAHFILVGEPDLGNPLSHTTSEIEQWVSDGVVEWWGHRHDMEAVFESCHIVCLPTRYGEGVPKVLIEAAAAGRPIVTTDSPGCRDIVRNEINGLLVQPGDQGALNLSLERLITNGIERAEMGRQGRVLACNEFALDRVIEQTLTVYADCLE